MSKQNVVIYHGACPDGFGAALSAWLALGESADYIAVDHGQDAPDVTGKTVYVLDFCFDVEQTRQMDAQAKELVILDHHESRQEDLCGFACSCGKVLFDLGKSGARLAWEHFHPDAPVPKLIAHIEDRDLWRWEIPLSREYLAELDKVPHDFSAWKRILEFTPDEYDAFVRPGIIAHEKYLSLCRELVKDALPVELDGQHGHMVNAHSVFVDDVGQMLYDQNGTFALVWHVGSAGSIKMSLRAAPGYQVKELAKAFGGGGHPRSAAFRLPFDRFPDLIRGVVHSSGFASSHMT